MAVPDARQLMDTLRTMSPPGVPVAHVEDRTVPGPAGEIPVRALPPRGQARSPLLVYFHGGGWVLGNLETHDGICRALAQRGGLRRRSPSTTGWRPSTQFPAAVDDCYAATAWAADNAAATRRRSAAASPSAATARAAT